MEVSFAINNLLLYLDTHPSARKRLLYQGMCRRRNDERIRPVLRYLTVDTFWKQTAAPEMDGTAIPVGTEGGIAR